MKERKTELIKPVKQAVILVHGNTDGHVTEIVQIVKAGMEVPTAGRTLKQTVITIRM